LEVVTFVIHETPFACWDWELQKKNLEFLEGIDADYFKYVADLNLKNLESNDKHKAALSLRMAYSHGLESLFALLCSLVQAPQCSIGWILNYKNSDLVKLVGKISKNEAIYTRFKKTPISWKLLANRIYANLDYDQEKIALIQDGFGKLWSRFASEFVDDNFILEYNGIKHGLRAKPGGFHLSLGPEVTPGVPAPPKKMISLGGSTFGTSYFVKEHIISSNKINFRPRRHFRNWSPQNLTKGLILISMSIKNVISFLRIFNGVDPKKCQVETPTTKETFEEPWKESIGVTHFDFDLVIEKEHIALFSKDDIFKSYTEKTCHRVEHREKEEFYAATD
jgi:hypothetical protein